MLQPRCCPTTRAVRGLGAELAATIGHMHELALFARFEWVPYQRPHSMAPKVGVRARCWMGRPGLCTGSMRLLHCRLPCACGGTSISATASADFLRLLPSPAVFDA